MDLKPVPCTNPNPFCAQIDPEIRADLCAVCLPVSYRKYKKLYSPNLCPRVLIVKEGLCAHKALLPDGKQISLAFNKAGDVSGPIYDELELNLFPHKARFAEVLKPLEGGLLAVVDVRKVCKKHPTLLRHFLKTSERRCAVILDHVFRMTTYSSAEKVAWVLSLMAEHDIGLDELTHEDIALLLNMNRVTVTKAMKTALGNTQH